MLELSEKVKENFFNPKNTGEMDNPDGMGAIENPICGDITKLFLRIRNGLIEDAKFLSFGCAVTIASASVFTEKIKGKEISFLLSGEDEEIIKRLMGLIEDELGGIPAAKLHCPPATVEVFLKAMVSYFEREGDKNLSQRIKEIIPKIKEYYQRGEEKI